MDVVEVTRNRYLEGVGHGPEGLEDVGVVGLAADYKEDVGSYNFV